MAMTKAEVREAFREVMAADYADVPKREEIEHTFSPEFYARMDALIAEQKRGAWRMMPRQSKRVLVVAAILAATLMLVACSPVLRHAVARIAVTIYETFIDFTVDTTEGELKTEIETVYGLNPLPEGFELVSKVSRTPYSVRTCYSNHIGEQIVIIQSISNNSIVSSDIERCELFSKTIEGVDVLLSVEGDIRTATVFNNGYFFTVRYTGTIAQKDFEVLIASLLNIK